MFDSEFKLYIKSKWNVLISLLLSIPILISYITTFQEKNEWAKQLVNPGADLNIQKVEQIVNGYSGISYLFNFLFSSDYLIIFILIAIISFSCMFGAKLLKHKNNGFGNMIIIRCNYSTYLCSMIKVQSLYVAFYLTLYFILIILLTGILFPFKFGSFITCNFPLYSCDVLECLKCAVPQCILVVLLVINISIFTSLSDLFVNNKYMIYSIPLILYFAPFILASTIGNIFDSFGKIVSKLVVDNNILAIYLHRIANTSITNLLIDYFCFPLSLMVVNMIMYILNRQRFKERYM